MAQLAAFFWSQKTKAQLGLHMDSRLTVVLAKAWRTDPNQQRWFSFLRSDQMEWFRRFKYQKLLQVNSAIDKHKLPMHLGEPYILIRTRTHDLNRNTSPTWMKVMFTQWAWSCDDHWWIPATWAQIKGWMIHPVWERIDLGTSRGMWRSKPPQLVICLYNTCTYIYIYI